MRKMRLPILMLAFIIGLVVLSPVKASAANQFTGGLLDSLPVQVGPAIGQGKPVTEATDNNLSSYISMGGKNLAWYTFPSPKDINALVLRYDGAITVEFYDDQSNLISNYSLLKIDGIQTLPATVKNVSTVVLKSAATAYVYEWNLFEIPSAPPSPTTISWIQGGDKFVRLDWVSTAAKSYNIKRSTSSGGPYSLLASNIADTTYTDNTVTNGTEYFYVVTAANEAGESVNSPQKNIKPNATQYTGGYLDGLAIDMGTSINNPTSTVKEITDNNESTYVGINNKTFVWHTFNKPTEINSVVIKYDNSVDIEFYDNNYNLLYSYTPLHINGVQTLPTPVKNVSTVVVKGKPGTAYVYEWNLFGKPSTPPVPTKINWIYGGDQIVKLDWDTTAAKFYNVKRATSSGGPYALLVANISGTTYTDKSVINGTTYYYVVSAVNEAGESKNSPESSIMPSATKYTGGLLDSLVINAGPVIGDTKEKIREITDNKEATYTSLGKSKHVWYTFKMPKEISSFIVNAQGEVTLELYDEQNNILLAYDATKNKEVETLPEPIKNVSTVVLKSKTGATVYPYEWNVFGTGEEEPTLDPIQLTASGGDKKVVLNWNVAKGATGYNVKRSTTAGGSYASIATVTSSTYTYTDTSVTNGTTYYYIVASLYGTFEGSVSNEASATPKSGGTTPTNPTNPDPGNNEPGSRALLFITLNNGIQKEYDLSMAEVEAFINWYEGRASGNGKVMFAFDKHNNNKGPFKNRKDYVFFDKIITFEVNGYDTDGSTPDKETGNQNENKPQPHYPEEEY